MPRKLRVQFPGAVYHVMSRGDRCENIFRDDVNRHPATAGRQKAGFQLHAYCLMSNHCHAVIETPHANLVDGMRWLLSTYTNRLNRRHKLFGHVFSGRYKAVLVESRNSSYLRTACDYVHLNPFRAKLLAPEDRLIAYPWSSLGWYQSAPKHRPGWIRTDRLLGAHGVQDTPAGRQLFEQNLEARRRAENKNDAEQWKPLRRGWCLGSDNFKTKMLALMEEQLGENHSGELKRESAQAKAERIIAEELKRLGWKQADLTLRLKTDPAKIQVALRLRRETTLTIKAIAERLNLGTANNASTRLKEARQRQATSTSPRTQSRTKTQNF